MSHFNFLILAFFTNFCHNKIDQSSNIVWLQKSGFQKLVKIDHFWHFQWTFVHSKCKRSSLRSQCWMRLFLWFSNTVCKAQIDLSRYHTQVLNVSRKIIFLDALYYHAPFVTPFCVHAHLATRAVEPKMIIRIDMRISLQNTTTSSIVICSSKVH